MALEIISRYEPTERQKVAHRLPNKFKLYGGAMGGGKTKWLCEEIKALMLEHPGNRALMARYTLKDFKQTTLVTLLNCIEPELLSEDGHNRSEHTIQFKNGSQIKYTGLSDEDGISTLKSFECGVIAIDEANEVSYDVFKICTTRLRWKLSNGKFPPFFILLSSNPEDCWLKDIFVDGKGGQDFAFIQALPKDNPHNPPEYLDVIRRSFGGDDVFIKRYLEGSWDNLSEGNTVIPLEYIEQAVMKEVPQEGKYCIGVDVARFGDDETVIYVGDFGRVIEKDFGLKRTTDMTALLLQKYIKQFDVQITCVDDIGVGGGVTDFLGSFIGMPGIVGVNVGERSADERFFMKRAELWWNAREMFIEGKVSIPNDPKLIRQLGAVKYNYRGNGKLIIEPKDETKKRLGNSPDRADALTLMLYAAKQCHDPKYDFDRNDFEVIDINTDAYGWNKFYVTQ